MSRHWWRPVPQPVVADLAGIRTGFATCYDIRFPELARALVAGGAELIVVPSAWAAGLFKEEHWVTLVRARAIENTVWVAAAGQVPDPASPPTRAPTGIGRSMLVDPMGTVRADLGPWPQLAVADLDPAMTAQVRAVLPCLQHRRDDVFGPAGRWAGPVGWPPARPGALHLVRRSRSADPGLPQDGVLPAPGDRVADSGEDLAGRTEPGDPQAAQAAGCRAGHADGMPGEPVQ